MGKVSKCARRVNAPVSLVVEHDAAGQPLITRVASAEERRTRRDVVGRPIRLHRVPFRPLDDKCRYRVAMAEWSDDRPPTDPLALPQRLLAVDDAEFDELGRLSYSDAIKAAGQRNAAVIDNWGRASANGLPDDAWLVIVELGQYPGAPRVEVRLDADGVGEARTIEINAARLVRPARE